MKPVQKRNGDLAGAVAAAAAGAIAIVATSRLDQTEKGGAGRAHRPSFPRVAISLVTAVSYRKY